MKIPSVTQYKWKKKEINPGLVSFSIHLNLRNMLYIQLTFRCVVVNLTSVIKEVVGCHYSHTWWFLKKWLLCCILWGFFVSTTLFFFSFFSHFLKSEHMHAVTASNSSSNSWKEILNFDEDVDLYIDLCIGSCHAITVTVRPPLRRRWIDRLTIQACFFSCEARGSDRHGGLHR